MHSGVFPPMYWMCAVPLLSVDDVTSTSITLSLRSAHVYDSGGSSGLAYHGFGTANEFGKSDSHSKEFRQPLTYTLDISLGGTATLLPATSPEASSMNGELLSSGAQSVAACGGSPSKASEYLQRVFRAHKHGGDTEDGPSGDISDSWEWLQGVDDDAVIIGRPNAQDVYSQVATGTRCVF